MAVFVTAAQNTALGLAVDFAMDREIEDRLMAPVATMVVALEKVVYGALRGLAAGIIMAPIGLPDPQRCVLVTLGAAGRPRRHEPRCAVRGALGLLVGRLGARLGTSARSSWPA